MSPERNARWVRTLDRFAEKLARFDDAKLPVQSSLTRRLLAAEIARRRDLHASGWLERDLNGTSSGAQALVEIVTSFDRTSMKDWRWTIARLAGAEEWARGYVALLRRGLEAGRVVPEDAVRSAIASVDAMLAVRDPRNPFRVLAREMGEKLARKPQLRALRRDLDRAIHDAVVPALRMLRRFLETTYLPRAARQLDEASYHHYLDAHLGPDHASPEALRAHGVREVARLRRELRRAVHVAFGSRATLPRAMKNLARSRAMRFRDPAELVHAATAELERARTYAERAMPVPRGALRVEPIPTHQEGTMLAQYLNPRDGEGTLQVNTTALLSAQRRHELPTLMTHEAFGGHHVAALHAEAQHHLPDFRRFAVMSAFDEGWALYAEQLRDEQGGYTPVERVGYLAQQLWRAARLVVDTGLHTGVMSRAAAVRYLERVALLPRARAEAEVRRYLDCPAQALAYYVGKEKLLALRTNVKRIQGTRFDLKRFHRKLLSLGAVPWGEAENALVAWARTQT